jgi:hypothetical protein
MPTVPDLVDAPELAAVVVLEHALDVVTDALLAEHPSSSTTSPWLATTGVLSYAHAIRRRAPSLRSARGRYRRAVREATTPQAHDPSDDDILF